MAIYHLNLTAVQRSKGRDATAAAAYRSGEKLVDARTGIAYDYTSKSEVSHKQIIGYQGTRAELWKAVELKHKRADATPAREVEVSLPIELSHEEKIRLAERLAVEINEKYGVAVDVCIHKINSNNPHAHLLMTACRVENNVMGKKVDALDPISCSRTKPPSPNPADYLRERWAELANDALAKAGHNVTIDHRSLKDQGIDREPQIHLGAGHHLVNSDREEINNQLIELNELKAKQTIFTRIMKTLDMTINFLQGVELAQKIMSKFKPTPKEPPTQETRNFPFINPELTLEQLIEKDAQRDREKASALIARNAQTHLD